MSRKYFFVLINLSLSILFFSCSTDSDDVEYPDSEQLIEDYLADNNIEAIQDTTGLYYTIQDYGDSVFMDTSMEKVLAFYTGYLLDGTIFDQTHADALELELATTIQGWQIGIPFIPKGGSGTLYIPYELGYGTTGSGSIPGGSVLIFDIEVVDFW